MHNSLFIREMLAQANRNPLCRERRDPHRLLAPDPSASPGMGEFALSGPWQITAQLDPSLAELFVADLEDFLLRMGVTVAPGHTITCALNAGLEARECRLDCAPSGIRLEGGDVAGLWAGVAWLEWEMRTRRGPILPAGCFTHRAAWPLQISQGPWGGNYSVPDFSPEYLGDDTFRLYAHYGVNSMMIYGDLLCYVDSAILPELNFPTAKENLAILQDAARRAARYGVHFSYVVVGPKLRPAHPVFQAHPEVLGTGLDFGSGPIHCLCSGSSTVHDFYTEQFTRLFTAAPELAGLILIVGGESFYHCHMWRHHHGAVPCPRCAQQSTEEGIAEILGVVQRGVTRAQPRAWVAAWAYNTGGWPQADRVEFTRRLPAGVALYHHIEKDEYYRKDGYTKHIWDYSVDYSGPSENMRRLAALAHEQNRPLFVKTETGIGLEVFQFPYVPAMQRLADKWQRVRELAPKGVQQSWLFFGMCGSRAEELGLWAAYRPEMERDELLRRMAARDFGPRSVDAVLASWAHTSRAMGHIPVLCLGPAHLGLVYYVGPSWLGPAHPLLPTSTAPPPPIFDAYLFYLQELEETFSRKRLEEARVSMVMNSLPETPRALGMEWDGSSDGWDIVIREYAAAAEEARQAWRLLEAAAPNTATEQDRCRLREETALTELVYRTLLACENTVRFLLARNAFERDGDPAPRAEMRRLAAIERDNARDARHIYRDTPWLDLAVRLDGRFNPCDEMLVEKVRMLEEFLNSAEER